jgi:hypothetical protein
MASDDYARINSVGDTVSGGRHVDGVFSVEMDAIDLVPQISNYTANFTMTSAVPVALVNERVAGR